MGRCSGIQIRSPHATYVLAQEGPELGFVRQTVGAPDACQGYGRQEYQTCQCGPSDVSLPDPSLSTPGLQFMGIRPDQAPDPTGALWLLTKDIWKVLFKSVKLWSDSAEDRGYQLSCPASSVSHYMLAIHMFYSHMPRRMLNVFSTILLGMDE